MRLTISKRDYLVIKALFNAASKESQRPSLSKVFFNHENTRLHATDGHIYRVENPDFHRAEWIKEYAIDSAYNGKSIFFSPEDFTKTEKILKGVETVDCQDRREYGTDYPPLGRVVPIVENAEDFVPAPAFAFDMACLHQLEKSINWDKRQDRYFAFGFQKPGGFISVYLKDGTQMDEKCFPLRGRYLGGIMPVHPVKGSDNSSTNYRWDFALSTSENLP